ncbi:MAG: hypothetical protein ABFR32_07660 [Bacteroidota bacterium]
MVPIEESLKNIWKKQEDCKIKFTKEEINDMIYQKSSSVVKWILIISILEFILPNIFLLFTDYNSSIEFYKKYDLTNIMKVYFIIHFIVILIFIYIFYKNYKNISVGNSVKELMKNIIKTRKTVKYYIYYNIGMAAIVGIHIFFEVFSSDTFKETLPENANLITIWILALLIFSIVLLIFWGIYIAIYGFLLKKLKINYAELKKNG